MTLIQAWRAIEAVLMAGSLFFIYAFGRWYSVLFLVFGGSLACSWLNPKNRWLAKIAKGLKGIFFVLLLLSFFLTINTVLLLRVDEKICSSCLVISAAALGGFYLYSSVFCLLVLIRLHSFFKMRKNASDNEELSSSISYRQLVTTLG